MSPSHTWGKSSNSREAPADTAMANSRMDAIRRLDLRVRELRRGRPVDPDTARFNDRVADGLRVTGDVIRWMRTGERLGEGVPVVRGGQFIEKACTALDLSGSSNDSFASS